MNEKLMNEGRKERMIQERIGVDKELKNTPLACIMIVLFRATRAEVKQQSPPRD